MLPLAFTSAASSRQTACSSASSCAIRRRWSSSSRSRSALAGVAAARAVAAGERGQAWADALGVGELLGQLERQLGEQELGLVEQMLAAGQDRAARPVPEREQRGLLVGAGVVAGPALERPRQQRVCEHLNGGL